MPALTKLAPLSKVFGDTPEQIHARVLDLFGVDDFSHKTVLDVGAGKGRMSCMAAILGAERVVALEPELDGATAGVSTAIGDNIKKLGLKNIDVFPIPMEKLEEEPGSFDYIFMFAVINHLDETHVRTIHKSDESRRIFVEKLKPVLRWLKPGGKLIVTDAARKHVFKPLIQLGILKRHPVFRKIDWDIHQQPKIWREVLLEAGFDKVEYRWQALRRIKWFQKTLAGNPFAHWLLAPYFSLHATRGELDESTSSVSHLCSTTSNGSESHSGASYANSVAAQNLQS